MNVLGRKESMSKSRGNLWGNFGYTRVSSWRASNIIKGFGSAIGLFTNYGSSLYLLDNVGKFGDFMGKFVHLLIKFMHYVFN